MQNQGWLSAAASRACWQLINLCYVDETIERKGFPCSWEWLVWGGWVQTLFAG